LIARIGLIAVFISSLYGLEYAYYLGGAILNHVTNGDSIVTLDAFSGDIVGILSSIQLWSLISWFRLIAFFHEPVNSFPVVAASATDFYYGKDQFVYKDPDTSKTYLFIGVMHESDFMVEVGKYIYRGTSLGISHRASTKNKQKIQALNKMIESCIKLAKELESLIRNKGVGEAALRNLTNELHKEIINFSDEKIYKHEPLVI
jgi:hypothetical protein